MIMSIISFLFRKISNTTKTEYDRKNKVAVEFTFERSSVLRITIGISKFCCTWIRRCLNFRICHLALIFPISGLKLLWIQLGIFSIYSSGRIPPTDYERKLTRKGTDWPVWIVVHITGLNKRYLPLFAKIASFKFWPHFINSLPK